MWGTRSMNEFLFYASHILLLLKGHKDVALDVHRNNMFNYGTTRDCTAGELIWRNDNVSKERPSINRARGMTKRFGNGVEESEK